MNLTPSVLFARGMKYQNDTPPMAPTNSERYADFRSRWPVQPVNNHPWKWLQK